MNEQTEAKGKKKEADSENMDPVQVIRKGAIAANIWQGSQRSFQSVGSEGLQGPEASFRSVVASIARFHT